MCTPNDSDWVKTPIAHDAFYGYDSSETEYYDEWRRSEDIGEDEALTMIEETCSCQKTMEMATELINEQFANHYDKADMPYINHLKYVSDHMDSNECKIVALLHDIVEDTPITLNDLLRKGFPRRCVTAIYCITKRESERYSVYLRRVMTNEISRKVKIEDLKHNMDLTRLSTVTEEDLLRVEKYKKALDLLTKKQQ